MAAVRAGGRAPVAGGEVLVVAGGSRRRTCASPQGTRRSISSRHRHGRQEATRWRVRAGNGAPVAGECSVGEAHLQAEVQLSGLHTRLSCARRARQHGPAASAC